MTIHPRAARRRCVGTAEIVAHLAVVLRPARRILDGFGNDQGWRDITLDRQSSDHLSFMYDQAARRRAWLYRTCGGSQEAMHPAI